MLEQEKHNTSSASLNATLPAMMKTLDYEYTKGTTGRWVESMGCIALCTFASLRYATLRFASGGFGGLRVTSLFHVLFTRQTPGFFGPLPRASLRCAALRFPFCVFFTLLVHLVGFVVAIALAFRRLLVPVRTSMGTSASFWGPFRQMAHLLRLLLTAHQHATHDESFG